MQNPMKVSRKISAYLKPHFSKCDPTMQAKQNTENCLIPLLHTEATEQFQPNETGHIRNDEKYKSAEEESKIAFT